MTTACWQDGVMSVAVTNGIRIEVNVQYVASRSSPVMGHYFFAYTVRISNVGDTTVRLVSCPDALEIASAINARRPGETVSPCSSTTRVQPLVILVLNPVAAGNSCLHSHRYGTGR